MNKYIRIILYTVIFGQSAAFWGGLARAEIRSDVHIQANDDAVQLDIDTRTYNEILTFFNEGYPIASVLLHAVGLGLTMDDAVYLAVKANRDRAPEIYATAAGLLPSLPGWVCRTGATGSDRYHRDYPLSDLGPQPTVRAVADRYFESDQRLAPFPDWQGGGYHMKASVKELESLLKKGWWYQVNGGRTGGAQPGAAGELTKRPLFISFYRENKEIMVDDNLRQVERAKQQGVTELPVVFVYNDKQYRAVSEYGEGATLKDVSDRYFSNDERLTAVPKWKDGDYHMMVGIREFEDTFTIPKKDEVEASRWAALTADIQQNGFKKPVLVSLLDNKRMWLDESARVAVAKDLGMKTLPTVYFYHGINRLACGLSATTCLDQICEAAVAAGADPSVCSEPPAAGGKPPPRRPPTTNGGGSASPS